jgi:oxygen-independent coproporphyrinogen-3 oxidase
LEKITIEKSKLSLNDYYFQILMMGLRMSKGIELKKAKYANAYKYFKNRIKDVKIKNNFLFAKNIN